MEESMDIKPRNDAQIAIMKLLVAEMGGDRAQAAKLYAERYARYFDEVLREHERGTPEDLLAALHKKVDETIH